MIEANVEKRENPGKILSHKQMATKEKEFQRKKQIIVCVIKK